MPKDAQVFVTPFETYTAVRQVGCGGSGVVFLTRASDGQELALKIVDRSKTTCQKAKRFQNEIQFCQRQASNSIVKVLDCGVTSDGSIFYLMPYYPHTLRDLMKQQVPIEERLPLYGQILDSVEAAHLLGVCHRDIKPENLLYDSATRQIVLADFGIARFTEDELLTIVETGPTERLANFAYAAPEQRIAGKTVDKPADIYALGLILNEIFTGEIPQGTGFRKIAEVASNFAYLDEIVDRMMQQQPEQRIQSVAALKMELIGRENEFVNLQKLNALKNQVVPETEISDPIIADPIRVVDKLDWSNNTLTLRLNQSVNPKWEQCFRARATAFTTNFSQHNIRFTRDIAAIRVGVGEYGVQQAVQYLKQYISAANETDLTGVFCTSRGEREFTRRTAGNAQQEVQSGTDRDVAASD